MSIGHEAFATKLFQTKICNFSHPISDLTENLIPYLSCYLVGLMILEALLLMVLPPNDKEEASAKNISNSRLESDQNGQNRYPISDQND